MTIFTSRRALASVVSASMFVLSLAPSVLASPLLNPSVSSPAVGVFEYAYELVNPADSPETIFDLGLFFTGDPLNVIAPEGWGHIEGLGFIDWNSQSPDNDLVPGLSLTGFSFQSAFGPGSIAFLTTGYPVGGDPFTPNPPLSGLTIGPVAESAAAPIPEPATVWLIASSLAGAALVRRKRARR